MGLDVREQLIALPYLPMYIKTVYTAIELDLFSGLTEWKTGEALAKERNLHIGNTSLVLGTLCTLGFLERDGDRFRNTTTTGRLLVKGEPEYMGNYLLFYWFGAGTVPVNVKEALVNGPTPMEKSQVDIEACRHLWDVPMRGCRDYEILTLAQALPEYEEIHAVLDLGCNVGMNGGLVIQDRPERTGVLFDQPAMLDNMRKTVDYLGIAERAKLIGGNFLTDSLEGPYDLVIASSIMAYVQEGKTELMRRIHDALTPGGVLMCVTEELESDCSAPWDMVLGYLPYMLHGRPVPVVKNDVVEAAREAGFTNIERREEVMSCGMQSIYIIRKER